MSKWLQKPPLGAQIDFGHPLSRGLVGCWLMNEGSGNRVQDLSGNGNHGISINNPLWIPGSRGVSLNFGGITSGQYVNVGTKVNPSDNNFSIAFTVKPPATAAFWSFLSSRQTSSPYQGILLTQKSGSGGQFRFQLNDAASAHDLYALSGTTGFNDDCWHTYIFVVDRGRNKAHGFLDGRVDFKDFDISAVSGSILSTHALEIARDDQFKANAAGWYTGPMASLFFWHRVLSPQEVAQLYAEPYCFMQPLKKNWYVQFTPSSDGADCTIISEEAGFDRDAASYTAYLSLAPTYYESSLVHALNYLNEIVTLATSSMTETIRKSVVAVELDGTALTAKTSVAEVDGESGSYWHDTTNGVLYIHAPDDGTPNHHTVIVYFWVYFATKGIVLDSKYYEPYIAENGIPSLSQESQEIHWGASKISSGSVVLLNGRGYFDQIAKRWIWNNKDIKLLLGGDSLPYSEYTSVFVGKIMQTIFTKTEFRLDIESKAFALLRTLPINHFWTTDCPELDPSAEGKSIPYYWGSYSAAQAPLVTCIDTNYDANSSQWKICDCTYHAIKSITQVYIDYGAGVGWETIAHANEDLANGTFTIETKPVLGTTRVKVAFEGYHSGGTLIEGAPEIVEDILLNQCGYASTDLNTTAFTTSKAASSSVLNVPVEKEVSALNIIETICQSDLAYFDEDGAGLLRYRTWEPIVTGTLPVLAKEDILEDPEITEDTSQLYYRVRAGYSWIGETGDYLYTIADNDESRYKYGRSEHLTIDTYLRSKSDADELAQRLNWITRSPSPVIDLTLKAGLIDKTLGDKIKVTLARAPFETAGGYDERVFEIIGKEISCFPLFTKLKARDLAGFGVDVGFWMGATAPAWADATAQEKDDSGFWCDANGYCLTADSESLNKSLWW